MILDRVRRITRDGKWIPEIDGLRFVAIASVLLFHLFGELVNRSGRIIPVEPRYDFLFSMIANGDRGVRLFFIISGMILAMPFARHYLTGAKPVSIRKYYMRRITRLEPPYIASIILCTIMWAIYLPHLAPHYWIHAAATLLYQHNLIYAQMSPVNAVLWSLEVEIQFYVLAPFVMLLFRIPGKTTRRIIFAAIIMLIGLTQYLVTPGPRATGSILYYAQYFLAGLLAADFFVLDLARISTSWVWDIAGFASLAYMFRADHDSQVAHVLLPFTMLALFIAAMRGRLLRRFFANPWIAIIGGMCYSIYLLHFVMIAAFFKVTRHFILPNADFLANYSIQVAVTAVPVVATCTVFYLLIERPCMDPDWPSKLWHKITGRSEREVEALDSAGVSE